MSECDKSISIKIRPTGDYVNLVEDGGVASNQLHEIVAIEGGELPALEYEDAPLPNPHAQAIKREGLTRKKIRRVGSFIRDMEIDAFQELGISVQYV